MPDEACPTSPTVILPDTAEPRGEAEEPQAPPPGLVLVSTPIGNLGDVSNRARAALKACDLILCEDTRHSSHLLRVLGVTTRTEPLHEHNEDARIGPVLARLRDGARIALISDAGTPLVSDPGYRLVRAAIAEGLPVTAVPGPNAAVTALVLSGLPPSPFLFLGFPPPRQSARRTAFGKLRAAERAGLTATLIWHEAPHRLADTLADMTASFGPRVAAVARELTKHFEEVRRGILPDLAAHYAANAARGEISIVIGPAEIEDAEDLDARLSEALRDHSVREAAALVTGATGLPRRLVYARALELAKS
jgi:16S rRNA (cytidine1402-2'-O)-methyltransferase